MLCIIPIVQVNKEKKCPYLKIFHMVHIKLSIYIYIFKGGSLVSVALSFESQEEGVRNRRGPTRKGRGAALELEGRVQGRGSGRRCAAAPGYRESWAGRAIAAVNSPTLPGGAAGSGLSKF